MLHPDEVPARARSPLLEILVIVGFAIALLAPTLAWGWSGIPAQRRLPEERMSAPRPSAPTDLAELSLFPNSFQTWFSDALGLREELLGLRSRVLATCFSISPAANAYLGTDRWVFLGGGLFPHAYRGAAPMSRFELDAWVGAVDARRRWCRARGIEYLFVLAPSKATIYPERHPLGAERIGPTRLDQMATAFAGDDVFLDLRPAVLRAKADDRDGDHAYFPYGSHWTGRGAMAGAGAIRERIRNTPRFEAWPPLSADEVIWDPAGHEGDTWAGRLYLQGVLQQNERRIGALRGEQPTALDAGGDANWKHISALPDPQLPRVVFFHDSFGELMEPFFAHGAARSMCVWHAFDPVLVEQEKPDLVVELYVEDFLFRPPIENLPEQMLTAENMFERSRETLFTLEAERDAEEIARRGGIEVRRDGSGFQLHWTAADGLAQLPRAVLPSARHVVARLDIAPSGPCDVCFYYLTADSDRYARRNSFSKTLTAGDNRVYLDLRRPGLRGPIVFVARPVTDLNLRACEVRAMR